MKDSLFDLRNKVALVTGASRGLGKAIAVGLAKVGANLVVCSHISSFGETISTVKEIGVQIIGVKADVAQKSDVTKMVRQAINQFGRIDILVNNAGIYLNKPIEEVSEEEWDRVIATNLKGCFLCSQAVGGEMIKRKSGKIINITSISGLASLPDTAVYCASKAGIILLTKGLAVDWAKYNINVNAIGAGDIATEMNKEMRNDPDFIKMIKDRTPMGRSAKPEEFLGTVIYLASKASDYVTGSLIMVDGGWTAHL